MFSTTRVPGGAEDTIMHYDRSDAKHVAVLYRGQWFRLSCTDNFGNLCTPHEVRSGSGSIRPACFETSYLAQHCSSLRIALWCTD